MFEVTSWIPDAVASTLRDNNAQQIIAWLEVIRDSIEEYDPLVTVRPPSPESEESDSPDSAFDEILSQLGKEIYKLDQYQENLDPSEKEVSLSILNIFDECLQRIKSEPLEQDNKEEKLENIAGNIENSEPCANSTILDNSDDVRNDDVIRENGVVANGAVANGVEESDCESTLSGVSLVVTSTPAKSDKVSDINVIFDNGEGIPVPPRRTKLKTPSSSSSYCDNHSESKTKDTIMAVAKRLESDSDSESTCWSYKECSDGADNEMNNYAPIWSHSSGYHNSDEILRQVLSRHYATVSRLSFDTASDFTPTQYSVYSLHEVGDTPDECKQAESVATMTPEQPDRPIDDIGYEPVRDAITDENIYEEIEYINNYTDEGCSCGGSVEIESCSISASSEGVGRESPLYANLRDHEAYAIPADVIFWKNSLLDPYYIEDEEDEWITPEECAVYSREQRPPFVIPRITPRYPQPRPQQRFFEDSIKNPAPVSYTHQYDWSPSSNSSRGEIERGFSKASSDSPPFPRPNKLLGGSMENLLLTDARQRANNIPASSSGDSLDVEIRETTRKNRKSRSMVAPKQRVQRIKSPIPAPRLRLQAEAEVILEGAIKRTKFWENGKKCKKNWLDSYMVLTPTALVFYKDRKTYLATKLPKPVGTPPSPTAPRAELVLPLLNARVMECTQIHTRKYARSLELTVGYDHYLLQDDSEEGAKKWFKYICQIIYKLGPPPVYEKNPSPQYQSSNTDLESLGRTPPVSRHNKGKQKVGGSSNEDLSNEEIEKTQVKKRLKKFFNKRPSKELLVKKGYYQDEPVFGRNLEDVCRKQPPRVPEFVIACIRQIQSSEENLCTDGLYRASGNLSQVQKIRLEIDQNNLDVIESSADIHVLTGSLKLFFRELKEPLIPCNMFHRILSACSVKSRDARIQEFREIVQALPQCNRDTLRYLLEHLLKVTQYSERNRMTTANLAIVFGPTLLWAPAEQAHNIAVDCIQQNHVVEILLSDFHEIFGEDHQSVCPRIVKPKPPSKH